MQMCNMVTLLSHRNNGTTTNKFLSERKCVLLERLTRFSMDFVLCNFADHLHAQTATVLHTEGKTKKQ